MERSCLAIEAARDMDDRVAVRGTRLGHFVNRSARSDSRHFDLGDVGLACHSSVSRSEGHRQDERRDEHAYERREARDHIPPSRADSCLRLGSSAILSMA